MSGVISQKEYLKKYLKAGNKAGEKSKKKKTEKNISKGLKIIDDDVTSISLQAQEDLDAANEDAPQIVAIIDERPPSLRIDDKTKNKLWQPISEATNSTSTSFQSFELQNNRLKKNKNEVAGISIRIGQKTEKVTKTGKLSPKNTENFPPRRNDSHYSDKTPPREKYSDYSPSRKKYIDFSPHSVYSSPKRRDGNNSPTRKKDTDYSPPRKKDYNTSAVKQGDTDYSPPRKKNKDNSSFKNKARDYSPPRKRDQDTSSVRLKDADYSPPRKRDKDYSSFRIKDRDYSPPRNRDQGTSVRQRDTYYSPPRKRGTDTSSHRIKDSDYSPPRKIDQDTSSSRSKDTDYSPPRKRDQKSSPARKRDTDFSPPRKGLSSKSQSPLAKSKKNKKSRWEVRDPSPPSDAQKPTTTMSGKKSGLQKAKDVVQDAVCLQRAEDNMFQKMSSELSGVGAATVVRMRKQEKPPDPEKEKREQELKEKYSVWGKGVKQVQDAEEKIKDQIKEMNKPLARYADDEDLEQYLKEQEREGDPMLDYIRKKKKKVAIALGVPEKPMYMGDFMPNRFGIRPGYRWDGVDRSNGYEKKWFQVQNSKKASQEEALHWSQEDM